MIFQEFLELKNRKKGVYMRWTPVELEWHVTDMWRHVARSISWAKRIGPTCIVGQGEDRGGGVLRPSGRCNDDWCFHLIYATLSLYFFRKGLIFLLSLQATWKRAECWIEVHKSTPIDFVDFDPSDPDQQHVRNLVPSIA